MSGFKLVSVFRFLFVLYMTDQLNVLFEKGVSVLNDKKIISAIEAQDERMLAFVVQKYSKLLWKIAASILINAASERMLDGMPVTAYNDLVFLFDYNGIEKVSGSLFSVNETGLEKTLLSPEEAVGKLQEQATFLDFKGESRVAVTEITLEYVVVMSLDGKILVTPVWRFLLGENEDERNFQRQKILGIDAVTGELIWEERGNLSPFIFFLRV